MVKTIPFPKKKGVSTGKSAPFIIPPSASYVHPRKTTLRQSTVMAGLNKPPPETRFRKANPLRRFALVTCPKDYEELTPGKNRTVFQIVPGKAFEVCFGAYPFQFASYHPGLDPFGVFANQQTAAAQLKLSETQVRDVLELADGIDRIIQEQIEEAIDANRMCPLINEEGNESDVALCAMYYKDRDPPTEIHLRRVGKNLKGEDMYGSMRECIVLHPEEWKKTQGLLEVAMTEVMALQPMHFAPKGLIPQITPVAMEEGESPQQKQKELTSAMESLATPAARGPSPLPALTNKKKK